jgi:asparagine synthase (glutamine-hydrolysing)
MCRIAGIINRLEMPGEDIIMAMRDIMQHGGPDDAGIYMDEELHLALGHRRLSLIDLSPLGHQPMMDASGNIVLVFNGEIYNFQSIKDTLVQKGYAFTSTSDTEVIIYAYLEWGRDCFARFNGMFALALLDKRTDTLLLARDHAGIKPLYYSIDQHSLYFASEVKAFKRINYSWGEHPHWQKYFLLFGHLPEPVTTLKNVQPLPKGHLLEINVRSMQSKLIPFFTNYFNYTIDTEAEAVEKVRSVLTAAVERHLVSDAPIGLFLSGGIDSSLLTILAKPFVDDNLHTLSIVFDDDQFSEKKYQQIVIDQTGAKHQSFLVTKEEFEQSLPDIIAAMDQPSYDGINSYFISKYAKQYGLKAVLSGLGADELFGGYPSFNRTDTLRKIKGLPSFLLKAADIFPDDKKKKLGFLYLKNILGDYLLSRGVFVPSQIAALLDVSEKEIDDFLESIAVPAFTKKLDAKEQVSYYELNWYMQNQLLKDTDYMSMWHSVEVRVPFLDKELMQLAFSIHPSVRFNAQQPKHLLIKAFKKELPEAIWNRPKQGFVFPFEQWMQQVHLQQENPDALHLHKKLVSGEVHWSRYWCYLLSKQEPISFNQ